MIFGYIKIVIKNWFHLFFYVTAKNFLIIHVKCIVAHIIFLMDNIHLQYHPGAFDTYTCLSVCVCVVCLFYWSITEWDLE